jgi:CRISPR-associated protein Csd1
MSWLERLFETYENNSTLIGVVETDSNGNEQIPLWPLWHITQKAHINITVDGVGNFQRASIIPKNEARTIIPASEESAGRTTNDAPQPLCDKLQYVAGDYKIYGGKKNHYFESYKKQMEQWCLSSFQNPKVKAVLKYIEKKQVVKDLINSGVLVTDSSGNLLEKWSGKKEEAPEIFKVNKDAEGQLGAFVRWSVEIKDDPKTNLWSDSELWKSWASYYSSTAKQRKICYVTGKESLIAEQHPKKIRNDGDGAKIISSNDTSGFTFRGRFTDGEQTCSVGSEVTQKAHSALRWLIGRKQAFRNGEQAIVSWADSGLEIPELLTNSFNLFGNGNETPEEQNIYQGDVGQGFSQRLKKYIAGYSVTLGETDKIIVIGLDSASPGRLAITYYRELKGSEFLDRIEKWHSDLVWKQRIPIEDTTGKKKGTKIIWPISAPAPKDIALAVYGRRIDDNLKKATVERLLPCIIDSMPLPSDLKDLAVHRACNRAGLEYWEWENILGIACSLYKGYYLRNPKEKRSYSMALELDRITRDYLYGRLLAAADRLESVALHVTEKDRPTTSARLMQRFSDRPFSTWPIIERALVPYRTRLKGYTKYDKVITEVTALFNHDDFASDKPLSGEFLLGYHCQREAFKEKAKNENDIENNTEPKSN